VVPVQLGKSTFAGDAVYLREPEIYYRGTVARPFRMASRFMTCSRPTASFFVHKQTHCASLFRALDSVGVAVQRFIVICDESGHKIFPFVYLAHLALLTPTQARPRTGPICKYG